MSTSISPPSEEHAGGHSLLDGQVAELQRLGFAIVSRSEYEVVATRRRWCWDCFATNITFVVFLKATGPLSAAHIAGETGQLLSRARDLDTGGLPIGLQHGRAVFPVYIADRVEPDAQSLCSVAQPGRFSEMSFPAALDRSTGQAYYLRSTALWGAIYFVKLRFLAARLLEPASAPAREPLSVPGLVLMAFIAAMFLLVLWPLVAG